MKPGRLILLALLIVVSACGGGSDDDSGGDGGDTGTGSNGGTSSEVDDLGYDSSFGEENLPAGFPSELIPTSFSAGQVSTPPGLDTQVVAFLSEQSFDDALEHYTGLLGEGQLIEAGGSRQAQWLTGPDWGVALFDEGEGPLVITFSEIVD